MRYLACAVVLFGSLSLGNATARPGIDLEAGSQHDSLTRDYGDWRANYLSVSVHRENRPVWYGELRETERFSLTDRQATVGTFAPVHGQLRLQLEVVGSDTHQVLPRHSGLAQFWVTAEHGWGAYFGLRRSTFDSTKSLLLISGIERYWGNFRGSYTLYLGRPDGADFAASHRIELNRYYGDHSSLSISALAGHELEVLGPAKLTSSAVREIGVSARHWMTSNWAISTELLSRRQGDFYSRRGARIALRYHF